MAFISMTFELENKKRCRSLSDQHLLARFHIVFNILIEIYTFLQFFIIAHLIREIEFEQVQQLPVQDLSKKLMEYLATHFTEHITLDTLAFEFNVSKYYISRIFSKRFKMNLRNYLSMLRVEYASMLIRTKDAPLTTVWMNAGFDSQRTFNRVFQAIYGMTPRDFKNNVSNYLK